MKTGNTTVIRLCYRMIIHATSESAWDKMVWNSTYAELQMQRQLYDPQGLHNRFADLLLHYPAAEKLHYLVSAAVTGYIQQLHNIIPGIQDMLGQRVLRFTQYRFEIINSNSRDKNEHSIGIHFYSDPLQLQESIGNHLVLALPDDKADEQGLVPVFTIALQPFLSIAYIKTA